MSPSRLLDTHIHLWPSTSLTPSAHAWMTPGHLLAKRHGIADYLAVVSPTPAGFVYVETDRYLPSPAPDIISEDEDSIKSKLQTWAEEPLEEIRFLKRIVEGQAQESDGVNPGQGALMKGCVIYAPFHVSPHIFQTYLHIAQEVAGPELWNKVVGFRYLLQGKKEGQVQTLVSSDHWLQNILSLSQGRNGRGWTFDVGVDVNRDGEAGLLAVGDMVREVRKRENGTGRSVKFIMNHLCKPPLSNSTPSPQWQAALSALSADDNVFMKLSGAFNEFNQSVPNTTQAVVAALDPYLDVVFANFSQRVMFGSDWPVCNVGGPKGEQGNWAFWRDVVEKVVEERGMREDEVEGVWWGVGVKAYGIEM